MTFLYSPRFHWNLECHEEDFPWEVLPSISSCQHKERNMWDSAISWRDTLRILGKIWATLHSMSSSSADVRIDQRKQSQFTQKSSPTMSLFQLKNHHQNFFPSWCLDLSVRTIPVDSVIVTENGVAAALEIVDKTASPADALFCMRAQSFSSCGYKE